MRRYFRRISGFFAFCFWDASAVNAVMKIKGSECSEEEAYDGGSVCFMFCILASGNLVNPSHDLLTVSMLAYSAFLFCNRKTLARTELFLPWSASGRYVCFWLSVRKKKSLIKSWPIATMYLSLRTVAGKHSKHQ